MKNFTFFVLVLFSAKLNAQCTPAVTINIYSPTTGTVPCPNTFYNVYAAPNNIGPYQWALNGIVSSITDYVSPYNGTTLAQGDVITCAPVSDVSCPAVYTVSYARPHYLTMSAGPSGAVLTGTSVTFTGNLNTGGVALLYTYNFYVNGVKVYSNFTNAATYTYTTNTLATGDVVYSTVQRNPASNPCGGLDTSNSVTMEVITPCVPSVAITLSSVTYTPSCDFKISATPSNGGNVPLFQWQKNGVDVGSNSADGVFPGSAAIGDVINCTMTSNASCANPLTATNSYTVTNGLVYNTTLSASPTGVIAPGTNVTFTDSTHVRGGLGLLYYSLYVNGVYKSGTLSGSPTFTYVTNTLADGDVVYCTTQTNPCAGVGSSNKIIMSVSTVLPVSLSQFNVFTTGNNFILDWSTIAETNFAYFNIQESTDGITFKTVGKVGAAGNLNVLQKYTYNFQPFPVTDSLYYFRLQMVDKDEKISFSPIQKASLKGNFKIAVFPNPAHDYINVNGSGIKRIQLLDMSGKILFQQTNLSNANPIYVSNFARGVYLLRVVNIDGKIESQKIVFR